MSTLNFPFSTALDELAKHINQSDLNNFVELLNLALTGTTT